MRRGLFSDTQPEIGQNIAGIGQIAVFIKISSAGAGGPIIIHQTGSFLIIFYRPICKQAMVPS